MLDLYAEQINAARSQDVKPVNTRADVDPDNIVVKPLLGDILWDQGVPFNGMTPGQTPTGCVATATAQIMRYWRYPDRAVGTHGYMSNLYGYLSHDYNYHLDWDDMPAAPNGTPDDEIQAKQAQSDHRTLYVRSGSGDRHELCPSGQRDDTRQGGTRTDPPLRLL